ncbi:MAG TPA: hypothetical protein VGH39_00505, partial [Xanthobacteraceae bacterium]
MLAAVAEQGRLLRRADQPSRECPRLNPPVLIKLTKLCYRLLNNAPTDTNAAYEAPIAVNLPVLPYCRVAQIHAPESNLTRRFKKIPKVGTTCRNQRCAARNPLIRFVPNLVDSQKPPQTAQVGLGDRLSAPLRRGFGMISERRAGIRVRR